MSKTKTALTVSALALGLIATSAYADIASTPHNLGTSNRGADGLTTAHNNGTASEVYTTGTDEICVFCHTPHSSSATTAAPLWNKALPPATQYKMYSSGTMQGSASFNSNSASLACLSCHDGTQAMDNMINAPGSDGYVASGSRDWNSSGLWTGSADDVLGNNGILVDFDSPTLLGTDLSNDHPVGIPYCGGGQTAAGDNSGCADPDFHPARAAQGQTGFVVGTSSVAKENMRLYGSSVSSATVECASCHDPHLDKNKTFLRISNSGSAVCLTCHIK
jgi:predicted CXXCH cytochrome family protein